MATLGERIKERREELDLAQEVIAPIAGVTRNAWAGWENKGVLPGPMNVPGLAHALQRDEDLIWSWIRDEVEARKKKRAMPGDVPRKRQRRPAAKPVEQPSGAVDPLEILAPPLPQEQAESQPKPTEAPKDAQGRTRRPRRARGSQPAS